MSKLNRERAARVLIEAEVTGNDRKAAERLGVSDRTIRNYRKLVASDPALAALFREYAEEEARGWHLSRVRSLRRANERAVELLAVEEDLDKVTRFIEKAGGTDLAAEALGVGTRHSLPGPPTEGDAGESSDVEADGEAADEGTGA